ncbi:LysR family transcriptional regulator [Burkholderia sp. Ac-20353]|uniref:LysR family transcriptional regulator n=1 Tax=Burkholderia sp. Ac-20353 TaxID=2703894 RepID=UPI00197C4E67|nr:LysR family transcriptional regulator [Burkholderia sp. Ac-20353]MBN3785322.1 LysR family transcriptional regulator [Burkholderia sp. Ac-20353]
MDTFQSMRLYARTVELGSFSAVAREEHITQPTMSKVIAALEKELGVRLLDRTTTSLTPTDEGRRFYERCKRVLEEVADAVADVRGQTQRPVGALSVSAPLGLGELRLNALMLEFLRAYPEIDVELDLTDRVIDLVEEGVDVAIRIGNQLPPDAVARAVAWSPRVLVAAPEYVARMPKIRRPEHLLAHRCVGYARVSVGAELEFTRGGERIVVPTRSQYRVNNSMALRECFLAAFGPGSAPAWLVQDLIDAGRLVRLLPKWEMPPHSVHLVTPSRRYQPLRTRVFLQFMAERIPALPGFQVIGV